MRSHANHCNHSLACFQSGVLRSESRNCPYTSGLVRTQSALLRAVKITTWIPKSRRGLSRPQSGIGARASKAFILRKKRPLEPSRRARRSVRAALGVAPRAAVVWEWKTLRIAHSHFQRPLKKLRALPTRRTRNRCRKLR